MLMEEETEKTKELSLGEDTTTTTRSGTSSMLMKTLFKMDWLQTSHSDCFQRWEEDELWPEMVVRLWFVTRTTATIKSSSLMENPFSQNKTMLCLLILRTMERTEPLCSEKVRISGPNISTWTVSKWSTKEDLYLMLQEARTWTTKRSLSGNLTNRWTKNGLLTMCEHKRTGWQAISLT